MDKKTFQSAISPIDGHKIASEEVDFNSSKLQRIEEFEFYLIGSKVVPIKTALSLSTRCISSDWHRYTCAQVYPINQPDIKNGKYAGYLIRVASRHTGGVGHHTTPADFSATFLVNASLREAVDMALQVFDALENNT